MQCLSTLIFHWKNVFEIFPISKHRLSHYFCGTITVGIYHGLFGFFSTNDTKWCPAVPTTTGCSKHMHTCFLLHVDKCCSQADVKENIGFGFFWDNANFSGISKIWFCCLEDQYILKKRRFLCIAIILLSTKAFLALEELNNMASWIQITINFFTSY